MGRITEEILYWLASRAYKRKIRKISDNDMRGQNADAYFQWQSKTSEVYLSSLDKSLISEKRILDLGCGLGGRTTYVAEAFNPNFICGFDINKEEIKRARSLSRRYKPALDGKVYFADDLSTVKQLATAKPFDIVLMMDVYEHARDPVELLREIGELLRPGGQLWIQTCGWHSPWASHMTGIIPIPWCQVLFSDADIINVTKRIMREPHYQKNQWDSSEPTLRWEGIKSLHDRPGECLNKCTSKSMRNDFTQTDLELLRFKYCPFGGRKYGLAKALGVLAEVPVLREFFHSAIEVTLIKSRGAL